MACEPVWREHSVLLYCSCGAMWRLTPWKAGPYLLEAVAGDRSKRLPRHDFEIFAGKHPWQMNCRSCYSPFTDACFVCHRLGACLCSAVSRCFTSGWAVNNYAVFRLAIGIPIVWDTKPHWDFEYWLSLMPIWKLLFLSLPSVKGVSCDGHIYF